MSFLTIGRARDIIDEMLTELTDQPYNERQAERILQDYMRVYRKRIGSICQLGIDREDVEQELRIALWQAWTRWDGRISLRRWLSWKLHFKLRDIERALLKRRHLRYPLHQLSD
jgi:DNA-directed RNA polymerase specialized sigma24 family protein